MRKNGPMERYPGIDEDARNHIVPGSNTIDNSPRPKGVKRGQGEDDAEHGPGVTPNPDNFTGPGIGLKK
jgi:hypothetical protein|uniref:Uncharacterized protein n=1 Tax=Siphoviridae sp. cthGz5 TaxID=2825613 RepID=A0A8S5VAI9_9CAUD|nr:MAG TPA: hypothetical protein [Siphoviridae sp. cthGz5]DAJ77844.1 MAG TPA: hypothetical protein [Caudoviricetes sp.]